MTDDHATIPDDAPAVNDHDISGTMIDLGGSFMRAIGKAFRYADDSNKRKLKAAFADDWADYARLTKARKRIGAVR